MYSIMIIHFYAAFINLSPGLVGVQEPQLQDFATARDFWDVVERLAAPELVVRAVVV